MEFQSFFLNFFSAGYIYNGSYDLIDVTNRSTRWGVWSPNQLNLNRSWSDEHGLNSLQILSYLLSSYRITGKSIYIRAFTVREERGKLILRPCNALSK